MPGCWGGDDILKEKTVFVWPSGTARNDKVDMKNVTFEPGMTERQVKQLLVREFKLDCGVDGILGLVDGYNQMCEKLSDIATNRKGYHIRYCDERSVEVTQLRKENEELKRQLRDAGGSSGGSSAELERLREENEKLRSENSRLKRELNQAEGLGPRRTSVDKPAKSNTTSLRDSTLDAAKGIGKNQARRGSLEDRAALLQPKPKEPTRNSGSSSRSTRQEASAPKNTRSQPAGASGEAQGDRIQDMALPVPVGSSQGKKNYAKLKSAWLDGAEDEALEPPDDLEDHIDDLLLADKPKYIKEAVPLDCLIDSLADQWMRDNVL